MPGEAHVEYLEKFLIKKCGEVLERAAKGGSEVPSLEVFKSAIYIWHLGRCFSGHGGDRLTVGLDDLAGLFQP